MSRTKQIIDNICAFYGVSMRQIAGRMGKIVQSFSRTYTNSTFKAEDFLEILDLFGLEIRLYDKERGEIVPELTRAGYAEEVEDHKGDVAIAGMADGMIYDTTQSALLKETVEGSHVMRLYRMKTVAGYSYFVVDCEMDNQKIKEQSVRFVSPEDAEKLRS